MLEKKCYRLSIQPSLTDDEAEPWQLINQIPGSKYLANRLLVMAALSEQPCELNNLPENDDIRALFNALVSLGYALSWPKGESVKSEGLSRRKLPGNNPESLPVKIDCGASGTMARFISAVAALDDFPIKISGSLRLQQRPMQPLFDALQTLGAKIQSHDQPGCLPVTITGSIRQQSMPDNHNFQSEPASVCVQLPGDISSQYISALLLVGARLNRQLQIQLTPPIVSSVYIKMTLQILQQAGVKVEYSDDMQKLAVFPSIISQLSISLNADPCSASYPLAAAAITGRSLEIKPFYYLPEQQGEFQIIDLLRDMGCVIDMDQDSLRMLPHSGKLKAISRDMGDMPDIVQTVAVICSFAEGVSRFENIAHLKVKESDRIEDTAKELRKVGIEVNFGDDWLEVVGLPAGKQLQTACIDSHDDHRMAMALSQLAWKNSAIEMMAPQVVAKSFPGFWQLMQLMGMSITECVKGASIN
ncbi:MAG TPA: 3-phosphoshikimate 1-carboxyvinyltransferase [Aeromonadales bacterium]|nr:3-phosphoshikimate 1-carboxyvinyltransferase [Aeromonadales bacterium]